MTLNLEGDFSVKWMRIFQEGMMKTVTELLTDLAGGITDAAKNLILRCGR